MVHGLYKCTLIQLKKNFGCFYNILLYHSMFIIIMKHQNLCNSYTDSSLLNMFTYLCHSRASLPRESVCSPSVVMPKSYGICFRHKATRHICTLCCTRLPKRSRTFRTIQSCFACVQFMYCK